ncbi:hypothetical protein BDB00DRAFT_869571 [Zychaea mexicana]|uniref:uncharacterized protein n=1 Tax=Zychaea mexicana TaxID=64656 RepID=UPI0022FF378D|nr:uncharacterized protein BDB00DRAFT_869571 [Zychaea mexicana]KAI9496273.1 hypothetical protein BDB00DRAFT_869571 [Zychaea mexicana]
MEKRTVPTELPERLMEGLRETTTNCNGLVEARIRGCSIPHTERFLHGVITGQNGTNAINSTAYSIVTTTNIQLPMTNAVAIAAHDATLVETTPATQACRQSFPRSIHT